MTNRVTYTVLREYNIPRNFFRRYIVRIKRLNRRKKRRICLFTTISAVIILVAVRTDHAVRSVAALQAEHHASAFANRIIGEAVSDYIDENNFTYVDFAAVLYDGNGSVVSVEAIPLNINRIQSELTVTINNRLSNADNDTAEIPIGSLTESYLLVGKGPSIKLRICPAAKASVELKSSFTSAGVNQTCHRISAVVNAELTSSVPLYSFDTSVCLEFLLSESILIGDVPEISRYAWTEAISGQ